MSNLEKDPAETVLVADTLADIEILEPREVPLGGPRAMTVRRTLPQRARSLVGAWCFVDHYGPEITRMVVPPHPHTGLQTVSWLFAGEVEHRDSVGSLATIRPGQLNLMTAGSGIAHSEVSPAQPIPLHGAQLWVALPDAARHQPPFFESFVPVPVAIGSATVSVFIGQLGGASSPARVFTPLLGAQVDLPAGTKVTLPVDATFEHGVLVDLGQVTVNGAAIPPTALAYLAPGVPVTIEAATDARLLLLGGAPLGERIVMWWNFIGRSHDEIVGFREAWQTEVMAGGDPDGRFGHVDYDGSALPAPGLPNVRLTPRA